MVGKSNVHTVATRCIRILGPRRDIIAQMLTTIPFEIKHGTYEMIHQAQHLRDN